MESVWERSDKCLIRRFQSQLLRKCSGTFLQVKRFPSVTPLQTVLHIMHHSSLKRTTDWGTSSWILTCLTEWKSSLSPATWTSTGIHNHNSQKTHTWNLTPRCFDETQQASQILCDCLLWATGWREEPRYSLLPQRETRSSQFPVYEINPVKANAVWLPQSTLSCCYYCWCLYYLHTSFIKGTFSDEPLVAPTCLKMSLMWRWSGSSLPE